MLRTTRVAALAVLALVAALGVAMPGAAALSATKTVNGCRADLYGSTERVVQTGIDKAYSETLRTNSVSCNLAAYVKYRYYGGATVYTSSTDWDPRWARVYGPIDTLFVSSAHFVNYDGPVTGRWFTLPTLP